MTGWRQKLTNMPSQWRWRMLAITVVVMTAAIPAQALRREWLLNHGTVVRLQAVAVDPYDLLRGAYVTLNYAVAQADMSKLPGTQSVLTKIAQRDEGPVWLVIALNAPDTPLDLRPQRPTTLPPGRLALLAMAKRTGSDTLRITIPSLQRYYANAASAKALEGEVRANHLAVEAVVSTDGVPALRGLWLNGKKISDERLLRRGG